jgi:hypothetical protein
MGRTEASHAPMAQQGFRKDQRAKNARATINKTIPQILASDSRARKGIDNAQLFTDTSLNTSAPNTRAGAKASRQRKHSKSVTNNKPREGSIQKVEEPISDGHSSDHVHVRVQVADTLIVAQTLHEGSKSRRNIAILNMASPLRPGGGVLNGATSQEESLCSRTTLLSSLKEEWYRLPEVGGIWSPDVLVFRVPAATGDEDLPRGERFYVNVVSAAMIRFPEVVELPVSKATSDHIDTEDYSLLLEKRYSSQKDRELALGKMQAVLNMLKSQKAEYVVLGAWGCGAYGNPISEIATAWKRAILGTKTKAVGSGSIKEIVFAIKDERMARDFAREWGNDMQVQQAEKPTSSTVKDNMQEQHVEELRQKIKTLELQVTEVKTPMLKQGLEGTLHTLRRELAKAEESVLGDEDDDDGDD